MDHVRFQSELRTRLELAHDSRQPERVLSGERMPTREFLEAAADIAGYSLEHCLHLPLSWSEASTGVPIVPGKQPFYRLLTAIYEAGIEFWITSIEGNLYGMQSATNRPLPEGVPPPPVTRARTDSSTHANNGHDARPPTEGKEQGR